MSFLSQYSHSGNYFRIWKIPNTKVILFSLGLLWHTGTAVGCRTPFGLCVCRIQLSPLIIHQCFHSHLCLFSEEKSENLLQQCEVELNIQTVQFSLFLAWKRRRWCDMVCTYFVPILSGYIVNVRIWHNNSVPNTSAIWYGIQRVINAAIRRASEAPLLLPTDRVTCFAF